MLKLCRVLLRVLLIAVTILLIAVTLTVVCKNEGTKAVFIANMAAIIGLIITILFFIEERWDKLFNRLSRERAFVEELDINRGIATEMMGANGSSLPESRFELSIIKSRLQSGEINSCNVIPVWNVYRSMKVVNSFYDQAIGIRRTEHLVRPTDQLLKGGRDKEVKRLQGYAHTQIETVQETLLIL